MARNKFDTDEEIEQKFNPHIILRLAKWIKPPKWINPPRQKPLNTATPFQRNAVMLLTHIVGRFMHRQSYDLQAFKIEGLQIFGH